MGSEVIYELVRRSSGTLRKAKRFVRADVAEVRLGEHPAVLAVPRTFMNESGGAVSGLARYYRVDFGRLLIIHDDIDLAFAKIRVQCGSGSGGNNGVQSVIQALGSSDFWRLKCGVGRPPGTMDPAAFVLKPFARAERRHVDLMVQLGADLVELFAAAGGEEARQRAGELQIGEGA